MPMGLQHWQLVQRESNMVGFSMVHRLPQTSQVVNVCEVINTVADQDNHGVLVVTCFVVHNKV